MSLRDLRQKFVDSGQEHVFELYDTLDESGKEALLKQIEAIDPLYYCAVLNKTLNTQSKAEDNLLSSNAVLPPEEVKWVDRTAEIECPSAAKDQNDFLGKVCSVACPMVSLSDVPNYMGETWKNHGLTLIAEGRVCVVLMGGGQGTRLGYDAPKGCYPIGPISRKSLFQIFCERILRLLELAKEHIHADILKPIRKSFSGSDNFPVPRLPLYIMTSEATHLTTKNFFKAHNFFSLDPKDIFFFSQKSVPSFSHDGKLLLEPPGRLCVSPNGNGGLFMALRDSGALEKMKKEDILGFQVFCVDNALAKVGDPTFFGLCGLLNADVGNKCIERRDPEERAGIFCSIETSLAPLSGKNTQKNGKIPEQNSNGEKRECARRRAGAVIEYSEMPPEMRYSQENCFTDVCHEEMKSKPLSQCKKGHLLFRWANIATHYFSVDFVLSIVSEKNAFFFANNYHVARKKIPHLECKPATPMYHTCAARDNFTWELVQPSSPNGWKLELFIFDVFPLANQVIGFAVERLEEFSPIKNKSADVYQIEKAAAVAAKAPSAFEAFEALRQVRFEEDTPESAKLYMTLLHRKWLEEKGYSVRKRALLNGGSDENEAHWCEVSPLKSYEGENLKTYNDENMELFYPCLFDVCSKNSRSS